MSRELPSKQELRQRLRHARQLVDSSTRVCQENLLCQILANLPQWQTARHIFAYIATPEEPSLAGLWQNFPDRTWVFPRCNWSSKTLNWHILNPQHLAQQIETDRYGIPSPQPDLPQVEIDRADVILVPALACDRLGYRLGYGGGFYDRSLLSYQGFTVGIVLHQFLMDELPHDAWDIRLKAVVSDREVMIF